MAIATRGASMRVMGTAFATGQAAGVAAGSASPIMASVDANAVRKILITQGALLDRNALPAPVEIS